MPKLGRRCGGDFGPPIALGATGASGSMSVSDLTSPGFAGLCFRVQALVGLPSFSGGFKLTRA